MPNRAVFNRRAHNSFVFANGLIGDKRSISIEKTIAINSFFGRVQRSATTPDRFFLAHGQPSLFRPTSGRTISLSAPSEFCPIRFLNPKTSDPSHAVKTRERQNISQARTKLSF